MARTGRISALAGGLSQSQLPADLPTCLSGGNVNLLTAEPALVISDLDDEESDESGLGGSSLFNMRVLLERQTACPKGRYSGSTAVSYGL
mmetsp:Transcript_2851/g.6845  ORF Transcript_2851/g.6845 Transcript_2851/m.6845 type:complete len:90 (+) Transcript_2851:550-819(+)